MRLCVASRVKRVLPLREPVNTCIGAPCGGDIMNAGFDLGQGVFDRPLHRGKADLSLPTDKGRAVVFDFKGIALHGGHLHGGG